MSSQKTFYYVGNPRELPNEDVIMSQGRKSYKHGDVFVPSAKMTEKTLLELIESGKLVEVPNG